MQSQMPAEIFVHPLKGDDTAPGNSLYPLKTLTQALRQATPGTIISPSRGTYSAETGEVFPLVVPPEMMISGNVAGQGGGVVIQGSGVYQSPTFGPQAVTLVLQGNAELRGITVMNPAEKGTGIWVESAEPTVAGCTITQCGREGILATGTANPLITNCTFQGNRASGATFVRNARGEVRNSLWRQNPFGLVISDQAAPIIQSNQFVENRCGMMLSGQSAPILRGNLFGQNQEDGLAIQNQARPNLGDTSEPGGNRFRDNQRFDLRNATSAAISSIGNQLSPMRVNGAVEFATVRLSYRSSGPAVESSDWKPDTAHWADPFVQPLLDRGLVTRQADGNFDPDTAVTPAEWTNWLQKANLAGSPLPESATVTHGQALATLVEGLALPAGQPALLNAYVDRMQLTTAQTRTVASALAHRLLVSPVTNRLNLDVPLSRAEAAALVYQALVLREQMPPLAHPFILVPAGLRRSGLSGNRRPSVVVIDPGHGGSDFGMVTAPTVDEAEFGLSMGLDPEDMMAMPPLAASDVSPEFLSGLPPDMAAMMPSSMPPTLPPEMSADMSQIMGDLPDQPILEEKTIVLSVAQALAEFLQQQGIQVVLTRTDDRDLSLAERIEIAQNSQAHALISLHANADLASRPDINGIETYYNPDQSESSQLAWAVHKALTRATDMIDGGAYPATFPLLRSTDIPAVHLEVGYITGDKDSMSLANLAYHRYLARAVASGIGRYVRQQT